MAKKEENTVIAGLTIGALVKNASPLKITGIIDNVCIYATGCHRVMLCWLGKDGESRDFTMDIKQVPGYAGFTEEDEKNLLGGLEWGKRYCDKTDEDQCGVLRAIMVGQAGTHALLDRVLAGETKRAFVYITNIEQYKVTVKNESQAKRPGGLRDNFRSFGI